MLSNPNTQTILSQRLKNMFQHSQSSQKQPKNNLYNHLCELLSQLPFENDIKNRNIDSYKQLTAISEYIKKNKKRQNQSEPLLEAELLAQVTKKINYQQWLINKQNILQGLSKSQSKNQKNNKIIQNLEKIHKSLFTNAGISIGNDQILRIDTSIKILSQKFDAKKIRFWGKILTKTSDYYIIQGVANKKNPLKIQQGMQKYGQGANYYSYWVNSTSMNNEWHQLPLITPQQIRTSRKIKYVFTGNLHAPINSYPIFQGQQQHFLKAQLVRITHNCQIAPKGLYGPLQQNPDQIQFSQQFKMPDYTQLSNLQNWVHINPHILQLGRNTYWVDPKLIQSKRQQEMTKLTQTDIRMERLKGINQDKPVEKMGIQGCWLMKTIGSSQVYNNVGKEEGTTSCYATLTLKNPNWPGWFTFANMNMFDSIYIGYAIKATQASFFPLGPENLAVEGQDIDEISQPNPANPPDELQPDSDDQNKKPEQ